MGQGEIASGLLGMFLGEARRRLELLARAAEDLTVAGPGERRARLGVIREAAHGLKGSALTVGLQQIAAAASELEQRAVALLDGSVAPVRRLEELLSELEALCAGLPRDAVPDERPLRPTAATRTVVCVEDDRASVALLVRLLAQRPWVELVTAERVREGVELVQKRLPDLVLLDLHLPDGSGEQLLAAVKADPVTARVPVVVMSADAVGGVSERLRAAGAVRYLTKPLDLRRLLEIVDEYAGAPSP